MKTLSTPLNAAQLEILKMFRIFKTDDELKYLKRELAKIIAHKAMDEADKIAEENGYTPKQMESWAFEHHRRSAK